MTATAGASARRVAVVTDAWHPQVNGVVQTWQTMQHELAVLGYAPTLITPTGAASVAVPGEPGLRLALQPGAHLRRILQPLVQVAPELALHIATEGPLGWAARRWARQRGWPFTTSYHTRFPEYLARRFALPAAWTYAVVRRFHAPSQAVLVPTAQMVRELEQARFTRVRLWPRGVDSTQFAPGERDAPELSDLPRPLWLNVGRVAPEKNLEAFLALDLPGSKVVVGDGPALTRLQRRFPRAVWLGARRHDQLAPYYRSADVFVFPSRTDTFGLVMLEAMACGTPVAAFPVTGPVDVVEPGITGVLDENLHAACHAALALDRARVRAAVAERGWRDCARILAESLVFHTPGRRTAGRLDPAAASSG